MQAKGHAADMDEYYVMPEEATAVADGAFAKNKNLKHIDLRNVRHIGAFAFQECTGLENVIMSNVAVIEEGAFEFCRSLQTSSITIWRSMTTKSRSTFRP